MDDQKATEKAELESFNNNADFLLELDRVLQEDYKTSLNKEELKEAGNNINALLLHHI